MNADRPPRGAGRSSVELVQEDAERQKRPIKDGWLYVDSDNRKELDVASLQETREQPNEAWHRHKQKRSPAPDQKPDDQGQTKGRVEEDVVKRRASPDHSQHSEHFQSNPGRHRRKLDSANEVHPRSLAALHRTPATRPTAPAQAPARRAER